MDLNRMEFGWSHSSGAVEFSEVRFKGDTERAANVYKGFEPLQPEDIADIIHFVVSRLKIFM
jgi:NADP-dependent 3-hydroxy acid dehydrogenase YdfG